MIHAKIIADSISDEGDRLTTLQLIYPRFIHAELMTHRVFSRNASSSRAIPVKKMIDMVRNNPAMPIHWGKNQPGMQANEQLVGSHLTHAKDLWLQAANSAATIAEQMMNIGLHKQVANRILEPFQHIQVVLTATEFDNWNELRAHPDAQPEIQDLARQILSVMDGSTPKLLEHGELHLPYVTDETLNEISGYLSRNGMETLEAWNDDTVMEIARKVSAARCCRVSYLKHDGTKSSIADDLDLCEKLAGARPIHASPFEHQATPMPEVEPRVYFNGGGDVEVKSYVPEGVSHIDMDGYAWSGNFKGWIQHRKLIEASFN